MKNHVSMRARRAPHARYASVGILLLAIAGWNMGCGAKQETSTTRRAQTIERFECVPERWSQPPENIGESPEKDGPDSRDLDPFRTPPSSKKD